ncbi:MAG: flagellar export protein FliJ [Oscillospiraceae bacterium]|nr:flagellar export protein FliJ [Oscillospiraceae bacterium]MCL2278241.1 flagellar export protein FliJ [Oscillospiraceae bacterium]
MKKFKFTLQALYNYKLTVEKLQKAELAKAQQALQLLLNEEQRIIQAYADTERSLDEALQKGENIVAALTEHDAYFRFLRDSLVEVRKKIVRAEEVVRKCQEKLIITMRELKAYDKLRDEQYQTWKAEAQAEEAKNIDDLVSFKVISEEA